MVIAAHLLPSLPTHIHKERQDRHTDHMAQAVGQGQGPGLILTLHLDTRKLETSLEELLVTVAAQPPLWLPRSSQLPGLAQALEDVAPTPPPGGRAAASSWPPSRFPAPPSSLCLTISGPELSRLALIPL